MPQAEDFHILHIYRDMQVSDEPARYWSESERFRIEGSDVHDAEKTRDIQYVMNAVSHVTVCPRDCGREGRLRANLFSFSFR